MVPANRPLFTILLYPFYLVVERKKLPKEEAPPITMVPKLKVLELTLQATSLSSPLITPPPFHLGGGGCECTLADEFSVPKVY
jgi:hypothetical protein